MDLIMSRSLVNLMGPLTRSEALGATMRDGETWMQGHALDRVVFKCWVAISGTIPISARQRSLVYVPVTVARGGWLKQCSTRMVSSCAVWISDCILQPVSLKGYRPTLSRCFQCQRWPAMTTKPLRHQSGWATSSPSRCTTGLRTRTLQWRYHLARESWEAVLVNIMSDARL